MSASATPPGLSPGIAEKLAAMNHDAKCITAFVYELQQSIDLGLVEPATLRLNAEGLELGKALRAMGFELSALDRIQASTYLHHECGFRIVSKDPTCKPPTA